MTAPDGQTALYPSRVAAGAALGRLLYQRVQPPLALWGVTPSGVEIAAAAAEAIGCKFDVVVGSHVRVEAEGIVGAMAEDADAVLDQRFSPGFGQMQAIEDAIDRSRRAIKQERLLFRGQRPLRTIAEMTLAIVDGHVTNPWKLLAAAQCAAPMRPKQIVIAAAVSTQMVSERVRSRRLEFVCPSVLMDAEGHPMPFGDPQDANAERLRSIVVARQAA